MTVIIRNTDRTEEGNIIGLCLGFIGLLGYGLSQLYPKFVNILPPCLFRQFTGIPCPSCGATRAAVHLSRFEPVQSLMINPFFSLFFTFLGLWSINALAGFIIKRKVSITLSNRQQRIWRILFLSLLPLNWLYLILFQ